MEVLKPSKSIWSYVVGIVFFLAVPVIIGAIKFEPIEKYELYIRNFSVAFALTFAILLARTIIDGWIDKLDQSRGELYNLRRIIRLISSILIALIIISFAFQKPYTTLAGLGLVSLVLGFALQAPITSFIGWLYIIFRNPYKVGDRIQISGHRGDVVEISYLDTIIRECSGDYLGNDRASGRIIHFPNSLILTGRVINYSGQFGSFIWNETAVQISYTSDLEFVEECLVAAANKDFKNNYTHRELSKENEASFYVRVNSYAWLEAVISYPVEPTDTTGRRNRILREALPILNEAKDKVGFPEGTMR